MMGEGGEGGEGGDGGAKWCGIGAAPLDPGSQARLIPFLHPETTLTQVWGMTETSCTCCMTMWNAAEAYDAGKWGSVGAYRVKGRFWDSASLHSLPPIVTDVGFSGKMLPNMDAKLVDDDGNDISRDDTSGELCVRGPLVVKGYYKNPGTSFVYNPSPCHN